MLRTRRAGTVCGMAAAGRRGGRMPFLNTIQCGESASVLKRMPSDSVDLVITSPPYFQQRSYGSRKGGGDRRGEAGRRLY